MLWNSNRSFCGKKSNSNEDDIDFGRVFGMVHLNSDAIHFRTANWEGLIEGLKNQNDVYWKIDEKIKVLKKNIGEIMDSKLNEENEIKELICSIFSVECLDLSLKTAKEAMKEQMEQLWKDFPKKNPLRSEEMLNKINFRVNILQTLKAKNTNCLKRLSDKFKNPFFENYELSHGNQDLNGQDVMMIETPNGAKICRRIFTNSERKAEKERFKMVKDIDAELKIAMLSMMIKELKLERELESGFNSSSIICQKDIRRLNSKLNGFIIKNRDWKLAFRGSEEEFFCSTFHQKCDSARESLVFVESKQGDVFGGYTSESWMQIIEVPHFKRDPNSFLFRFLSSKEDVEVFKIKDIDFAIKCDKNCGTWFGNTDFNLLPIKNTENCQSEFPKSYEAPNNTLPLVSKKFFNIQIRNIR